MNFLNLEQKMDIHGNLTKGDICEREFFNPEDYRCKNCDDYKVCMQKYGRKDE